MPWVIFKKDFDWQVPGTKSKTTIAYKAGMKVLVKQKCADDAAAAGVLDESADKHGLKQDVSVQG